MPENYCTNLCYFLSITPLPNLEIAVLITSYIRNYNLSFWLVFLLIGTPINGGSNDANSERYCMLTPMNLISCAELIFTLLLFSMREFA